MGLFANIIQNLRIYKMSSAELIGNLQFILSLMDLKTASNILYPFRINFPLL